MTRRFFGMTGVAGLLCSQPELASMLKQRHRPRAKRFVFGAIGDQQYGEAGLRKWPALQAAINQAGELKFVVHAGDIKSGQTSCEDSMFAGRRRDFDRFRAPLVLTPGDNEWTDCHRADNGSHDPIERLAMLRKTFYPGAYAMGQRRMRVSRQSEDSRWTQFVENAMWNEGNVLFASLHIVGSNNNFGRNEASIAEWKTRTAANQWWLETVFKVARENGFGGLVVLSHANPGFRGARVKPSQLLAGMRENYALLARKVEDWNRPVLLIHGDSHQFHYDKPLLGEASGKLLDRFTRLEVPGSADVHWVRVLVDPSQPQLFAIEHRDVPANYERP